MDDGREKLIEENKNIYQFLSATAGAIASNVRIEATGAYKEKLRHIGSQVLADFYKLLDTLQCDRLIIMFDASEWLGQSENVEVGQWVLNEFLPELHEYMWHEHGTKHQKCSFVIASRDSLHL